MPLGPISTNNQMTPEFERLSERFKERKEALEAAGEKSISQKEIAKEVIEEQMEIALKNLPVAAVPPAKTPLVKDEEAENLIKELIQLAFDKNVVMAVERARKTGNFYLLDALHDRLVDEFYNQLVQQNKIKKL